MEFICQKNKYTAGHALVRSLREKPNGADVMLAADLNQIPWLVYEKSKVKEVLIAIDWTPDY